MVTDEKRGRKMAVAKDKFIVKGFKLGAAEAGVRYKARKDLGLILADAPCSAAGLFTLNRVKAPSVTMNKRRLKSGLAQAVLVNSGNANACVGKRGMDDAIAATAALAGRLAIKPSLVLMNSTGVIGEPLPGGVIEKALPALVASVRPGGIGDFTSAIMTTDTRPKIAGRSFRIAGKKVTLAAAAKGAGMIMPNMATMLAYVLTDAEVDPPSLREALAAAAEDSFNAMTIDGDTSTSDSLIVMAGGASGARASSGKGAAMFREALKDICLELAREIAADGEGATKWFAVTVKGAKSKAMADKVARRVANSPLVKTAFHAGDPNWGRVMMAVGSAGAPIKADAVNLWFISSGGSRAEVVENGALAGAYSEAKAAKILSGSGFTALLDLGLGNSERTIYTCDFSADYVRINADYRS